MPTNQQEFDKLLEQIQASKITSVVYHGCTNDSDIAKLTSAIVKNKSIDYVMISAHSLTDSGAQSILSILQHCPNITSMGIIVEDASSPMTDRMQIAFAKALEANKSITNFTLYPGRCINETVALAFSKMLTINKTLSRLDITLSDANALQQFLAVFEKNSTLTWLEPCIEDRRNHWARILEKFLEKNRTLTTLRIRNYHAEDTTVQCVARALKSNKHLQDLTMMHTSATDQSARAIADMIKTNNTLKTLNLSGHNFQDEGVIALAEALKTNKQLRTLELTSNTITQIGVNALIKTLEEENETIQQIFSQGHGIESRVSEDSLDKMRKLLQRNGLRPKFLTNNLNINQGEQIALSSTHLNTESNHGQVAFHVVSTSNGQFFDIETDEAVVNFTQQEINDGKIGFVADGSTKPPAYTITASNEKTTTLARSGNVTFIPLFNERKTAQKKPVVNTLLYEFGVDARNCHMARLNESRVAVWIQPPNQATHSVNPRQLLLVDISENCIIKQVDLPPFLQEEERVHTILSWGQEKFVVITHSGCTIRRYQLFIFDSLDGQHLKTIRHSGDVPVSKESCVLMSNQVVIGCNPNLNIVDLNSGIIKVLAKHKAQVNSVVKISDRLFASADGAGFKNSEVNIWDIETLELQKTCLGHNRSIHTLATFGSDMLASSGSDNTVKLWDIKTGHCIRTLNEEQGNGSVFSVTFLNENRLAAAHAGTIKIYDIHSGKVLSEIQENHGNGSGIYLRALKNCPNFILSASGSTFNPVPLEFEHEKAPGYPYGAPSLKVWNIVTGEFVHEAIGAKCRSIEDVDNDTIIYPSRTGIHQFTVSPTALNQLVTKKQSGEKTFLPNASTTSSAPHSPQTTHQKSLRQINSQLFKAATENNIHEIERLLNCGADINSPHIDPRDGTTIRTPLSIATEMGNNAAVELLSQRGASLQPSKNTNSWSLYGAATMLSQHGRRFFKPTFDSLCEALSITITHPLTPFTILFGAIALFYKDEILKDNYKLASAILGFTASMMLCFNLLKLFKNISNNINQTHERVIANLDASERAIDVLSTSMTLTTAEVIRTLSTLTGTTQEVMIQLKDETKNALIELTGDARHVALAIEQGIRENRFKPEAHVVANTHVNATAHVNTSAKVNVPLKIGAPRILPNFVNRILPRALRF